MRTKNKILKILLCFVLILSCVTGFTACGNSLNKNSETTTTIVTTTEEKIEDYVYKTDILNLHFPAKWNKQLRVDTKIKNNKGNVSFYGKVGKHKEQLVFTVKFGTDADIPIGVIKKDTKKIKVGCELTELKFDDSWTQDENDTLSAMQEDVNYMITFIKKENLYLNK